MALWFLRGLRRGVVTTRYPDRPAEHWVQTLTASVEFRSTELTSSIAAALVEACPSHALSQDNGALVYDVGACTGCGRCRALAPTAVVGSSDQELAATDRADLVKRIPISGDRP